MHDQVRLRNAIAERYDLDVSVAHTANPLVAILAEYQRLTMLQQHDVFAASILLGQAGPCAIVEDVAILQNLDESRALVRCRSLQRVLQVRLKDINRARHKRGFRADSQ